MKRHVDYYFSVASPWTYLGHERFRKLALQYDLEVSFRPVDFERVLKETGGSLYQNRSEQRKRYRQIELERWRRYLGIALTLEPAYYPVDRTPASLVMVACKHFPQQTRFRILQAILASIWRDDLDIANWQVLGGLLESEGSDSHTILATARQPECHLLLTQHTDDAIAAGVFGAPTYVLEGELFWGQDRLALLALALDSRLGRQPIVNARWLSGLG